MKKQEIVEKELKPGAEDVISIRVQGVHCIEKAVIYRYMAPDWKIYSTQAPNATSARLRRDAWLRGKGLVDVCPVPGCKMPAKKGELCSLCQQQSDDDMDWAMSTTAMAHGL